DHGRQAGPNLFHSFNMFNVAAGESATFDATDGMGNIIVRVTGGKSSSINGTLRSESNADLYLMNPAGVSFGPSASLDLRGGFFVTTGRALNFDSGPSLP